MKAFLILAFLSINYIQHVKTHDTVEEHNKYVDKCAQCDSIARSMKVTFKYLLGISVGSVWFCVLLAACFLYHSTKSGHEIEELELSTVQVGIMLYYIINSCLTYLFTASLWYTVSRGSMMVTTSVFISDSALLTTLCSKIVAYIIQDQTRDSKNPVLKT